MTATPTAFATPQDLIAAVGALLGPTGWMTITQREVDKFAQATGDHQWIHVDPVRAAHGPFSGTIAHGYLTLALAGRFVPELITVTTCSSVVNYGCDRVRFLTPVRIPGKLRGTATIADARATGDAVRTTLDLSIELEGADRPACVVRSVLHYVN